MRVVCIIDTVAIELQFVSKQDVTMQLATAIEPLAKIPSSQQNRQVQDVALAVRGMDTRPLHLLDHLLITFVRQHISLQNFSAQN